MWLAVAAVAQADEFDTLRLRWVESQVGPTNLNLADLDISNHVAYLASSATQLWTNMLTGAGRTALWSDTAQWKNRSTYITTSYSRLRTMAQAWAARGSSVEGDSALLNDIVGALDWMQANVYNESQAEYDNWWDWEIGAAQALGDTVALLYPQLTETQVTNYLAAVEHFTPVPNMTAANLVDKALVVAVRGALVKDAAKLVLARDALSDVFPYVTSDDGFYADGSFIQHHYFPYTGGYGRQTAGSVVTLLQLLNASTWEVTDAAQTNVVRWVYDSFAPQIYKGAVFDAVRGRAISRWNSTGHSTGADLITTILRFAQFAPEPDATTFKQMVKYWIQSDTSRNFVYSAALPIVPLAKDLLNDPAVVPATEPLGHYHFGLMDRAVHLRPGYGASLALSSSRIANYESLGGENLRGWYTGDGLLQLYNNDLLQFDGNFWPTVNPYRLPGTTVDTQARADASGQGFRSASAWTGGATLAGYGSAGMELDAWNSTLTARKSWFMLDDEIICLGAGITSSDNRTIETIIENRKLTAGGTNALVLDGAAAPTTLGWDETLTNLSWAALAGNVVGADLGYYFPGGATVRALREQRTGDWSSINTLGTSRAVTNNFLTLWFDHGANPAASSYAYVLLPNRNAALTAAYAASPASRILTNTAWAQGIVNDMLGVTAVNFWTDGANSLGGITVDRKCAVLTQRNSATFSVALADPTQVCSNLINITFPFPAGALLSADAGVSVVQLAPYAQLAVNVAGAGGRSFHATFSLPQQTINFDSIADQVTTNSVSLSATASSGLPVGFELVNSTNAVLVGNVLTFTAAGSVSVRAVQPGNVMWAAAEPVTNTFTVTKVACAITLAGLAQTYSGSGLVVSPSAAPPGLTFLITYDGSPVAPVNAGAHQVIVTIQDGLFQGSVTDSLVIAKADQTLTFNALPDQGSTNVAQLVATAGSGLPVAFSVVSGPALLSGTSLTFTNTGAVVIAAAQPGDGNWNAAAPVTNSFAVVITSQTLFFPALPDQLTTNVVSLNAVAASGLPVSYELISGGNAVLMGNTLAFTGEGAVSVRALQSGNELWAAAEPVTNSFAVTKTPVAITLAGLSQSYTGGGLVITPTAGQPGLAMSITYNGSALAPVAAGSYQVIVTIQDGLYQGSATGTLTIAKAAQSISFPVVADQFITNTLALAATATSGLPVTFSVASGPAVWDGEVLSFTNYGPVSITASQAGDSNWQSALLTRTFNVTATAQTITFPSPGDKCLTNVVRLAATASSGLPVSFSVVDGPGLLNGTNLTFNGVGPVSIVAAQSGGGIWAAARSITNTINVTPYPTYTKPDFLVHSLVTTPAVLTPGCTFSAVVTVRNSGTILGNAGVLKLWVNHSATALATEAADASQTVGNLAVGASAQLTFSGLVAPSTAGTFYLRAFVDGNSVTPESSEGNNQLTLKYVLTLPDFIITALTTSPSTPAKSAAFSASVTIKNQGGAAGNAGVLRLWANHTAVANLGEASDIALNAGTLAAGASATLTVSGITAPNADGTYTLRAFVDADGATAEQSEGNNQLTKSYTITTSGGGGGGGGTTTKPDFLVTAISFSPNILVRGAPFTAYITILNNSTIAGNAGSLDVYLNSPTLAAVGTVGTANQTVGLMTAAETRVITFTGLVAPAAKGTYTFRAFIDSRGLTAEQSEGNNQKTKTYGFYY